MVAVVGVEATGLSRADTSLARTFCAAVLEAEDHPQSHPLRVLRAPNNVTIVLALLNGRHSYRSTKDIVASEAVRTSVDISRPLIDVSTGSYGLGLAHAARRRGASVHVFVNRADRFDYAKELHRLGAVAHLVGHADRDLLRQMASEFATDCDGHFVDQFGNFALHRRALEWRVQQSLRDIPAISAVMAVGGSGACLSIMGTEARKTNPNARVLRLVLGSSCWSQLPLSFLPPDGTENVVESGIVHPAFERLLRARERLSVGPIAAASILAASRWRNNLRFGDVLVVAVTDMCELHASTWGET